MRFVKLLLFYIISNISLIGLNVSATKPTPTAVVDKTTIPLIIPLAEHDLELKQSEIKIDLTTRNILNVNKKYEQQALITMTYNIYNPTTQKQIDFVLPFISKFNYLPYSLEIEVNNIVNSQTLLVYDDYFFKSNYISYTDYIENFNYSNYKQYELKNDYDGYLYTITNLETKGTDYYAETSFTFSNYSDNAFFVDTHPNSNAKIYKSKEVDYFFITEDVNIKSRSLEYKKDGYNYTSEGIVLEKPTIKRSPIKLSQYFEFIQFGKQHNGAYHNEYKSSFYKELDQLKDSNYIVNYISTSTINYKVLDKYQDFSYKFNIDFQANETSIVQISYLTPLYCKTRNFEIEVITNPHKKWNSSENIDVVVISDDKLDESSKPYVKKNNIYEFKDIGKDLFTIKFDHNVKISNHLLIIIVLLMVLFSIIAAIINANYRFHKKRKSSV